jgi:hypothetical protein
MIGLVVHLLALILLIACWLVGEQEPRTKLILTGIYVLSWLLAFVDVWALIGTQAVLALVLGALTFAGGGRR